MKVFKISILTLVIFGMAHFLVDFVLVRVMPLQAYIDLKFWIGKITIALAIIVVSSLLCMLIKFLIQKKNE